MPLKFNFDEELSLSVLLRLTFV